MKIIYKWYDFQFPEGPGTFMVGDGDGGGRKLREIFMINSMLKLNNDTVCIRFQWCIIYHSCPKPHIFKLMNI